MRADQAATAAPSLVFCYPNHGRAHELPTGLDERTGIMSSIGMSSGGSRETEARRKAQRLWDQNKKQLRKAEAVTEVQKARDAETDKTARLRALRLAKEATDKEADDREVAAKQDRLSRKRGKVTDPGA
jgi:hypothetical protein